MIKQDLLFRDSHDPSVAAEVEDMGVGGKLAEQNQQSWDTTLIEDVEDVDLQSEVDDTEDGEVVILMLDKN